MQVDIAAKELTVKLVYYGPALSGKTTNLRAIQWLSAQTCGEIMSLETRNDRTLLFDMLPISLRSPSGVKIRMKLFTVPGQMMHDVTRRLVLQEADGIAFIAHSQRGETNTNRASFSNLEKNLGENGIAVERIPIVIQFNKRDLRDVRTDEEIALLAKKSREPIYTAVANRGQGVMETLVGLVRHTWSTLDKEHRLQDELGIDSARFMSEVEALLQRGARRGAL